TSCRGSTERSPQDTDPDVPSSISAVTTETGSDEVFIISAGPGTSGLSFTTYRIQEQMMAQKPQVWLSPLQPRDKNLKRSVTSPASVSDWLSSQPTAAGAEAAEKGNVQLENPCPRQRTWSARTFHDFLAPIPQLQKRWCSWSTNSPFTKLVDSTGFSTAARSQGVPTRKVISATEIEGASETVYSDSSASNASYPLTLSAQRQRKLTSCNLKKSRFGNPYFGILASSPDSKHVRSLDPSRHLGAASPVNSQSPKNLLESSNPLKINLVNSSKTKDLMVETDKNKPVFVISEEGDDQQPLVLAEHLSQCGDHLSEQNAVYAPAVPEKQLVVLTAEGNSSATFTSSLPLWAKSPTSYKGHGKAPSSSRDQQSSAGGDANTTETSQNCDTPAAPTLQDLKEKIKLLLLWRAMLPLPMTENLIPRVMKTKLVPVERHKAKPPSKVYNLHGMMCFDLSSTVASPVAIRTTPSKHLSPRFISNRKKEKKKSYYFSPKPRGHHTFSEDSEHEVFTVENKEEVFWYLGIPKSSISCFGIIHPEKAAFQTQQLQEITAKLCCHLLEAQPQLAATLELTGGRALQGFPLFAIQKCNRHKQLPGNAPWKRNENVNRTEAQKLLNQQLVLLINTNCHRLPKRHIDFETCSYRKLMKKQRAV
ncbi:hypothetical protein IHE44_0006215, partial [Lamprotornis superbus]